MACTSGTTRVEGAGEDLLRGCACVYVWVCEELGGRTCGQANQGAPGPLRVFRGKRDAGFMHH